MANRIESGIIIKGLTSDTNTLRVKGIGNSSSTNSLWVENLAGYELLKVRDDRTILFGNSLQGSTNMHADINDGGSFKIGNPTLLGKISIQQAGGYGLYGMAIDTGSPTDTSNTSLYVRSRSTSGATAVAGSFISTVSGGSGSNLSRGLYVEASGADFNQAIIVPENGGYVGFGITTPTAIAHFKGENATSSNYGLKIDDSTSQTNFYVRNDGVVSSYKGYWQNNTKILHQGLSEDRRNIYVGQNAGNITATGQYLYGIGYGTLTNVTSGQDSIAIGLNALTSLTTGKFNVAIGSYALQSLTTEDQCVAVGYGALSSNVTGWASIGVGHNAGAQSTGVWNIFVGRHSGYDLTSGEYNLIVGTTTGIGLTGGSNNTIIGSNIGTLPSSMSNALIVSLGDGTKFLSNNYGNTTNVVLGLNSAIHSLPNTKGSITVVGSNNIVNATTATTSSDNAFAILGYQNFNNLTGGTGAIALGTRVNMQSSGSYNHVIGIGTDVNLTASNQMVVGGQFSGIDNVFLGHGVSNPDANVWAGGLGLGLTAKTATAHIKGSDATSSNYGLKIDDSTATNNFYVRNDGVVNSRIGYHINGNRFMSGGDNSNMSVGMYTPTNATLSSGGANALTIVGHQAGFNITNAAHGTFVGAFAGYNSEGSLAQTMIGKDAGKSSTNGGENVFIGYAVAEASEAAKGKVANINGDSMVIIGSRASVGATGLSGGIALGFDSVLRANGQFIVGSQSGAGYINQVYIGAGQYGNALNQLQSLSISPTIVGYESDGTTRLTNTSASGATLYIDGSRGTGTGTGGDIIIRTSSAGGSGNSLNSLSDRIKFLNTGIINIPSLQTGNSGLSSGDLYKDTAANILSNGDYIVAMKA